MEIRQLEMLMAVVERRGYFHAGEYLHVAHSAIHRQVRLLEEELGEKVFVRVGRTVQLTETGKLLFELASKIRQEVAAVEQQVKDKQELLSGNLRIGAGTTALIFFLPPVLREFRREYPGLQLYITTSTADQVVQDIQAGNLHLGLVSEPLDGGPVEKNIRYERLYTEQYDLAVSKKHGLRKREAIRWSDLKDVPIISFPRSSRIRHLIDARFEEANVIPNVTMELENEEAIELMINITFGARFLAKRRIDNTQMHGIRVGNKPITLNVAAVLHDSYAPRCIREFLRICKHQISLHDRTASQAAGH